MPPRSNVGAALLQQAQQLDESGRKLLEIVATSGFTLRQQLRLINANISEQIIRGEPDLQSVLTIAAGQRATAVVAAPGFPAVAAPGIRTQSAAPDATEDLRLAMVAASAWMSDMATLDQEMRDLSGDNDVVHAAAFAVHADRDAMPLQSAGEVVARKLATLVGIEYLRPAVVGERFLERRDAKIGAECVRYSPRQHRAADPVCCAANKMSCISLHLI